MCYVQKFMQHILSSAIPAPQLLACFCSSLAFQGLCERRSGEGWEHEPSHQGLPCMHGVGASVQTASGAHLCSRRSSSSADVRSGPQL